MFSVLNIFNKYLVVSYNCCHSGDNLGLWAHSVLDQWHLHLEISCLHGKQRGYTVDVKVFLSCFFFGYLYFQNKSISDSFWFVSLCLFVFFCTWTVVCTYKLGTRVMNSQIFGVLSTCGTCFIFSYNTQLCARRVIFEFSKFLNIAGCLLLKKIWVWRFK